MIASALDAINQILLDEQCSLADILVSVIQQKHTLTTGLVEGLGDILGVLAAHVPSASFDSVLDKMTNVINSRYYDEVMALTDNDTGWHFSALHTTADQLEGFVLEEMGSKMRKLAPRLWAFLDALVPRFARTRSMDSDQQRYQAIIIIVCIN